MNAPLPLLTKEEIAANMKHIIVNRLGERCGDATPTTEQRLEAVGEAEDWADKYRSENNL